MHKEVLLLLNLAILQVLYCSFSSTAANLETIKMILSYNSSYSQPNPFIYTELSGIRLQKKKPPRQRWFFRSSNAVFLTCATIPTR